MKVTPTTTLQEVKDWLNAKFGIVPTECPACRQNVHKYPRPIHGSMVKLLIELYRLDRQKQDYYHVSDIYKALTKKKNGSDDFSKFSRWGMIVQKKKMPGQLGRTSGYWAITPKGRDFVEGKIRVPRAVYMFNKISRGFTPETVDVKEALGSVFDYEQMMAGLI